MGIYVIKPGVLTTIQDMGRFGYQKFGFVAGGAMDTLAYRVANILVGNEEAEASLEITVVGPTLYFEHAALIAICGAAFKPMIDGEELPLWRPVWIEAGQTLHMGSAKQGMRAYIAVAGGFKLPKPMNSYSTYLRAQIGGLEGRMLKADDVLQIRPPNERSAKIIDKLKRENKKGDSFASVSWKVSDELLPRYALQPVLRVLPGSQFEFFRPESLQSLFQEPFVVEPQSDRMGYRLKGAALQLKEARELLSEPVVMGTVQVPSDGNPIVLMADRQTTGGYPKIAQVISVDLPLLAQAQIGNPIRFELIDIKEAQRLKMIMDLSLLQLQLTIKMYSL